MKKNINIRTQTWRKFDMLDYMKYGIYNIQPIKY